MIKPEFIKPGACLIDVGLIRVTDDEEKEKLVGDVDFEGNFILKKNKSDISYRLHVVTILQVQVKSQVT